MPIETPPCRVCGKSEPVLCFPTETPALAICPDCCDAATHPDGERGHRWEHDRWEKDWECVYCGIYRRFTHHSHDDVD